MVEWLSGNRIIGTSTERTAGTPAVPAVVTSGGWKELGRTTFGGGGSSISVTGLEDKRYYMVLSNVLTQAGTNGSVYIQTNGDVNSNYGGRRSVDGSSDVPINSTTEFEANYNTASGGLGNFGVSYWSNLATKEKLGLGNFVSQVTTGAGTAPSRSEFAMKHNQLNNPISSFQYKGNTTIDSGAEVVVLGWDEDDTHTTNFWEELADVSLSSTNTSLDSGTFTAKKYLWVQMYQKGMTGNNTLYNFNSDTGSNYARRWRIDGGTEFTTSPTTGLMCHNAVGTQTDNFFNMFIVNNSANEKLVISHSAYTISTGAGSAPSREEHVGKWTNTSSQITSIQFDHGGSNFGIGSSIKVWGSN